MLIALRLPSSAEIQNAISVGELPSCLYLRFVFEFCTMKIKLFSLIVMKYLLFYIVENMNPQCGMKCFYFIVLYYNLFFLFLSLFPVGVL